MDALIVMGTEVNTNENMLNKLKELFGAFGKKNRGSLIDIFDDWYDGIDGTRTHLKRLTALDVKGSLQEEIAWLDALIDRFIEEGNWEEAREVLLEI